MYIRNAAEDGQLLDNVFEAVDDATGVLGKCVVQPVIVDQYMENRLMEIKLSASGEDGAQLRLLAAGMARAMKIASDRQARGKTRIYAECPPEDGALYDRLRELGFRDDDALVRMRRKVFTGMITAPLPEGCVPVIDKLEDPAERRFFLERLQRVFQRGDAALWLKERAKYPLFARLLLTARSGLAGEAVIWADKASRTGVIGLIYTAPDRRRMGVATYLLEMARRYFSENRLADEYTSLTRFSSDRPQGGGLSEVVADARLSMTPVVQLLTGAGYRRAETILRLPGMEI